MMVAANLTAQSSIDLDFKGPSTFTVAGFVGELGAGRPADAVSDSREEEVT